jgi:hypothetical protein
MTKIEKELRNFVYEFYSSEEFAETCKADIQLDFMDAASKIYQELGKEESFAEVKNRATKHFHDLLEQYGIEL